MIAESATASPADNEQDATKQPSKRRRIGYACDLCRLKKNRCDGERPSCQQCRQRRQECVYSPQRARVSVTQDYVEELKMRNEMLERQLAATQQANSRRFNVPTLPGEMEGSATMPSNDGQTINPGTQYMSPSQNQIPDRPRAIDQQQAIRLPSESHTAASDPATVLSDANKGTPTEYFGESSTFDFMAKVSSPEKEVSTGRSGGPASGSALRDPNTSLATSSPSVPLFELLSAESDDPFGLPSRFVADRLVDAYFKYRHPLNPYLHEGTFRQRYRRLWLSQDLGGEEATQQSLAWYGLVNLVFAFGSDHANVTGRSAGDRSRYFKRAKTLLVSGMLQVSTIELVQALLLMGQYLHGALELNNCWTVIGLAIRTAQGLGLHLNPVTFTSDMIEQEVRKRVWWGCFVLDRVLSMKVGRPTIPDGPGIEVGMPLAVDDEFLSNEEGQSVQPQGVPSKLEYFNQVIPQCRLMEKILKTLYSGDGPGDNTQKARPVMDTTQFLALSIQLDGELTTWQENLPSHLKPGAEGLEWHFERQRNVLLMRYLHARHLIHRQTLLLYITRRVTDPFQREIMLKCVKRCVTAAYDSITQMGSLHHQNKLSSFWHNSHYVFAALGVLLNRPGAAPARVATSGNGSQPPVHANAIGYQYTHQTPHQQAVNTLYPAYSQEAYQPTPGEGSLRAGFEDEFANIESMLMDSTGWTGLMDDWSDNPTYARFTYNGFA
ncbi:Fungal Zn2-Cys6 binuclear cluster domain-containing protein [Cladophialophora immunda]|nr:Fungal Zn2-Cys6 binuclear cluster domain-containing protein [Cladophialophora immunda]